MPRTRPWEVSDEFWEQVRPLIPVLATWDIRSEKRLFESDLLVLFCLQERSDKGRIRGHACISCFGIFLSLCKGEACVSCSHPYEATTSSSVSRALRWHCSWDETALHLSSAWNDRGPCQREVPTACRKRVVTAATHHPASAGQTTDLQEDRSVPLGASGEDDADLEAGALHSAAGDRASLASGTFPLVLETQVEG